MGKQNEGILLSQKKNSTGNIFVNLQLALEILVREEQKESGILTDNIFV